MFSPVNWSWMPTRQTLIRDWDTGLMYMTCVLAILLTHEMGHFIATLCHRIRASLPYFLPIPINPIGTLGAVIGMDGRSADRRQMFDIGIAGPIAGLVVAIPITWIGVQRLDLEANPPGGTWYLDSPLAIQWMLDYHQPPGYQAGSGVWISQVNPYFMAGWIGLLITGLNMLPVSQLDGGHVTYTLFGKAAHWVARGFMVAAIAYVVYAEVQIWVLMIILVLLMGTDHPPTKDDRVPLGWFRTLLGYSSLLIPILCFPPKGLIYFAQALTVDQ
jgi:membrane-associated protease RseP (regulator of RpoE activity)